MGTRESRCVVGDYVTLVRGTTYQGSLVGKPGPALLGLGSIEPGGGFREGHYKTYGGDCPAKLMLFSGDLYVALKGATKDGSMVGSVARVPETILSGRLTQDTVKLNFQNPNPHEVSYIYWLLRTPQYRDYCANHVTGSAVAALSREDFLDYPVPPLTDERKQLVSLFELLENKIELNRQMNHTLESIARALFKSWFIEFDPVRAKMDGRQPAGMDAETAALFPDGFEDSVLGKIPKGWEISSFGELLDLTIGGDWGKELPDEKHTQPIAIIRGTDIASVKAGIFSKIPRRYTTLQKIKSRALLDGDIVIEVSGGSPDQPTGRSCYVTDSILAKLDSVVVPASFCRLFRPKTSLLGIILKLHLEVLYSQGGTWIYQNQSTGISNFQTQYFLENELVLVPTIPIQKLFFETIRSIADKQHSGENLVLFHIRDALLPKLLSGEIRIKDAGKILESIA